MSRLQILLSILIVAVAVVLLVGMGRPFVYEDGSIKFWTSSPQSHETSQQISDPYTLTHVEHGILFYLGTTLLPPQISFGARFLVALGLESVWEVFENTPFVIDRYRSETISLDYYGDTVINTLGDILAAMLGFLVARRFSWKQNLLILFALELLLYFWIADGLLMNIVQLI